MRRFEYTDPASDKFWEIEVIGPELTVRFGRQGTTGQTSSKVLPSADKAAAEGDRLIREKVGKGYAEVAVAGRPAAFDWTVAVATFARTHQAAVADLYLEEGYGGLCKLQESGRVFATGATARQLETLEQRLQVRLPPSYRACLQVCNGLLLPNLALGLLPVTEVDWFIRSHPDWVDDWMQGEGGLPEPDDQQYLVYGPEQDCGKFRPRYLATALMISYSMDGDVLLLNPEIRCGEEWEAWYCGCKFPGAIRYRSFEDLMRAEVFEEK